MVYGPALALSEVTGFDMWVAILTTGLVCIFYTALVSYVFVFPILFNFITEESNNHSRYEEGGLQKHHNASHGGVGREGG